MPSLKQQRNPELGGGQGQYFPELGTWRYCSTNRWIGIRGKIDSGTKSLPPYWNWTTGGYQQFTSLLKQTTFTADDHPLGM